MFLSPQEWSALRLSCQVGACAVALSLPLAIPLAYLLARSTSSARWIVQVIVDLPLVLPPVVTGYLLLVCFAPQGAVGRLLDQGLGWRLLFTWWAAALASAVVSFPLLVRSIRLAFQGIDRRLELAARGLGASRLDTFFSVSLPLAKRGVLAGAVLAFARSLGEFGATIMVAGNIGGQTQTIPLAIYSLANRPGGIEQCWRLVVIAILLAGVTLAISEYLERRPGWRETA